MIQALSIREHALLAVMAALVVDGTPANACYRSQLDNLEQSQLPCYDLTPGEEKVEESGAYSDHGSVTRTLPIVVRALVDATDSDDSALDPFYVFAVQQLTGGSANLDGTVIELVEQGNATVFKPNGANLLGLEMHFELIFATRRGDPTQKG